MNSNGGGGGQITRIGVGGGMGSTGIKVPSQLLISLHGTHGAPPQGYGLQTSFLGSQFLCSYPISHYDKSYRHLINLGSGQFIVFKH